jgi:hypothetical protein
MTYDWTKCWAEDFLIPSLSGNDTFFNSNTIYGHFPDVLEACFSETEQ